MKTKKDIQYWKDWIVAYLVPRRLWAFWRNCKDPQYWWAMRQKASWAETLKVGDIVCDCRGMHVAISDFRNSDDIVTEGGHACSIMSCCSPPKLDNSCHYVEEEEANV